MSEIISDTGWQKKTDPETGETYPETGETYFERNFVERFRAPEGTDCTIPIPPGLTIDPEHARQERLHAEICTPLEPEPKDSYAYCPRCDLPNLEAQALAFAARRVIDDIKRTVDLDYVNNIAETGSVLKPPFRSSAIAVVIHAESIRALHDAVKAVFDEK